MIEPFIVITRLTTALIFADPNISFNSNTPNSVKLCANVQSITKRLHVQSRAGPEDLGAQGEPKILGALLTIAIILRNIICAFLYVALIFFTISRCTVVIDFNCPDNLIK